MNFLFEHFDMDFVIADDEKNLHNHKKNQDW